MRVENEIPKKVDIKFKTDLSDPTSDLSNFPEWMKKEIKPKPKGWFRAYFLTIQDYTKERKRREKKKYPNNITFRFSR